MELYDSDSNVYSELVSIIIPFYNAASYLHSTLSSILEQNYQPIEVVLFDDGSSDNSIEIIEQWHKQNLHITVILGRSLTNHGPGFARNEAVSLSHGSIICHLDADDYMLPTRISQQMELWRSIPQILRESYIIGTNFHRPMDSTPYYTSWLNAMSDDDLMLHKFRECTIICPTWLYSRALYDRVAMHRRSNRTPCKPLASTPTYNTTAMDPTDGNVQYSHPRAFVESSEEILRVLGLTRIPEDLYFFLDALELGARLIKVPQSLLAYTYSPYSWTLGSKKEDLAKIRCEYFERMILLPKWETFSIWGYGRDGKKFLKSLSPSASARITCFVDIDDKKIGRKYFNKATGKHIPIIHFSQAVPPLVICVASKRTGGLVEKNIETLGLTEGVDYFHFS